MSAERALLESLRVRADLVINTTGLSAAKLRGRIADEFLPRQQGRLALTLMSFGFKQAHRARRTSPSMCASSPIPITSPTCAT